MGIKGLRIKRNTVLFIPRQLEKSLYVCLLRSGRVEKNYLRVFTTPHWVEPSPEQNLIQPKEFKITNSDHINTPLQVTSTRQYLTACILVASWLARSTPDRAVQVQALAGDIVLCSWALDTLLTQCLSPPRCVNGYRQIHSWG